MPLGDRGEVAADRRQRRMAQHHARLGVADAVPFEDLARQIEPAALRVLVEVAQDVGQLQGAAERIGDGVRVRALIAEDVHRQMADRAGDPRAIEVERRQIGGANVFGRVHLHPVDHREEVLAAQAVAQQRLAQRAGDQVARAPVIERLDLRAPGRERRLLSPGGPVSSAMSSTSRQKA